MNLLARREHSEIELSRKLQIRGFPKTEIEAVILALTEEKLLSNHRFIENYIYYRRNKGFGPLKIQAELIERGIPPKLIETYLNPQDTAWFTEAYKTWKKRFKNTLSNDFKQRAAEIRFLSYRGFTKEQIEKTLWKK